MQAFDPRDFGRAGDECSRQSTRVIPLYRGAAVQLVGHPVSGRPERPAAHSGRGAWRTGAKGPVQVVSGPLAPERVRLWLWNYEFDASCFLPVLTPTHSIGNATVGA